MDYEHAPEEEPERSPRELEEIEPPEKLHSTRSIFDDIDTDEERGIV